METRSGAHGTVGEMLHEGEGKTGVAGTACASRAPEVNSEAQGSRSGWCTGAGLAEEEALESGTEGAVTGLGMT